MSAPDDSDAKQIKRRMQMASAKLNEIANDVGNAYTVEKFKSERIEGLLAKYSKEFIEQDIPATKAAIMARANPEYQKELAQLFEQHRAAEQTIALWKATHASHETGRSLLSYSREHLRNLEG